MPPHVVEKSDRSHSGSLPRTRLRSAARMMETLETWILTLKDPTCLTALDEDQTAPISVRTL